MQSTEDFEKVQELQYFSLFCESLQVEGEFAQHGQKECQQHH